MLRFVARRLVTWEESRLVDDVADRCRAGLLVARAVGPAPPQALLEFGRQACCVQEEGAESAGPVLILEEACVL